MNSNEYNRQDDESESDNPRRGTDGEPSIDFDSIDYSSIFIDRRDLEDPRAGAQQARARSIANEHGDHEPRRNREHPHERSPLEAAARGLDRSVELHEKTIVAMHEFVQHIEKLSERQARIEHDLQTLRSWNQRVQIRGLNHFNY